MMQSKRILGITGGVGTGKSTVLRYLQEHFGALVIELDQVAASLQEPGNVCYDQMVMLLGDQICQSDGRLDRKKIAAMVFADAEALQKLNEIIWPAVKAETMRLIEHADIHRLIVIEAALLIEDGYDRICDEIWFVKTCAAVRAQRIRMSRGYDDERIRNMLASQKEDAFYEGHAAFVIDNGSDDIENTYRQVDKGLYEHGFLQHCQRQQR